MINTAGPMARVLAVALAGILVAQGPRVLGVRAAAGGRDAEYYLSRWSSRSSTYDRHFSPVVSPPQVPPPPSPPVAVPPGTPHRAFLRDGADDVDGHSRGAEAYAAPRAGVEGEKRDSRFFQLSVSPVFPLFSLVRVSNTPCVATSGDNGTCYTSSDCSQLGGSASGTCSSGFGSCCVFQKTCGESTSQNCTYFVNTNYPDPFNSVGSCQLTVNKANTNICQLRLDFVEFTLSGPDATEQQCLTDRFSVAGASSLPIICGVNSGNHMYVDLGRGTTTPASLTFVTMGPSFDRKWKVKVTQIPCNTDYTAPSNCVQYYTGVSGKVMSYNFDLTSGLELANQDYTICIRTEKNFCGIQYAACADAVNTDSQSFTLSGRPTSTVGSLAGATSCTKDWLTIPCVTASTTAPVTSCQDRLCGDNLNVVESRTAGNVVVYSFVRPFVLIYHTDATEGGAVPSEESNRGFCLDYVQQPCV
ncbi:uncharacterized protein LOC122261544 [Penaeus japonicus]|uniref:uncharacterized protein LOC122261544 n=1 Tax=Penaeus japonicus TaxID=27405 RepID=UPI001C70FCFB|nr:uncharacterized protein LOC122261544 [Penaeus japonicus]